jgi:hypothetical protein
MSEDDLKTRFRDVSLTAIATILGALLALVGVYTTGWFNFASKDEELRVHLVDIAIGILRSNPKDEGIKPIREWAMDIIDRNSGIQLSKDAREALLEHIVPTSKSKTGELAWTGPEVGGTRLVCYFDANGAPTDCRQIPASK